MRYGNILIGILMLLPQFSIAAPSDILIPSVIPKKQDLSAVEYFNSGRQSGCGLRVTGETQDDIWLNILITVFLKESDVTFGAVKIVARKIVMENGKPLLRNGRVTYLDVSKIKRAWIKPDSREWPIVYENGGSSHGDSYMATVGFSSTMDLLVSISQEGFKVGVNRGGDKLEEIYQFNQRISQEEAGKLSLCMNNLRDEIEESRSRKIF